MPAPERPADRPAAVLGLAVDWPAPERVCAQMSLREGGFSSGAYASLNLGDRVGDDPIAVQRNRERFAAALGARCCWLAQVHGVRVVDAALHLDGAAPQADAAWTRRPGIACTVQVADCLPVLLAARNGRAVGAAHAGWRGLAAGVVEAAVVAVARAARCDNAEVIAWLGPCIGPSAFEVGPEVLEAFGDGPRFALRTRADPRDGRPRWLADLPGLAHERLRLAGVAAVHGGHWCTVSDASRFFSFRRDGVTGRLAAGIALRG